jgi:hypothetical protein
MMQNTINVVLDEVFTCVMTMDSDSEFCFDVMFVFFFRCRFRGLKLLIRFLDVTVEMMRDASWF